MKCFVVILVLSACSAPVEGIKRPIRSNDVSLLDTGPLEDSSDQGRDPDEGVTKDLEQEMPCEKGCIASIEFVGVFYKEQLQPYLEPGIEIDNGYSIYWILYETDGRLARASITIPAGLIDTPAQGWPIAVNNPGTVGLGDKCAIAFSVSGSGLSGYFGARGWVGVTIDYPGLGASADDGIHPYLDGEVEGKAALDAIRATQHFLKNRRIKFSGASIIAGLSQGGHATLWAASLQKSYAPELDIRAYAVVAPASGFQEHWSPGMGFDGPHLVYHAMLTYAWRATYGAGENPWSENVKAQIDAIMEDHCNFPTDTVALTERLGSARENIFSSAFTEAFKTGDFSDYPFMEVGFSKNRVRSFTSDIPIRVYQGDVDEVVLKSSTDELVESLREKKPDIEYLIVPGGGHTNIAFSFLAFEQIRSAESLSWLKEKVSQ